MKKIMALCLAMLMALSMVSFSVMAEETAVDFSEIANGQPQKFVTGDLDLGANEITSSNEAIIALDGTVTRPIYEDATVTLTINGGAPFDVKVKAKTVEALYVNDFSVDEGDGITYALVEGNDPCEVTDGVLKAVIGDTTNGRTWIYFNPEITESTMPVTIEFDMSNITGLASAGADLRITGARYDAEGNKIGSISTVTVARCSSASGFQGYGSWGSTAYKKNVSLKYNPATGEFWFNGGLSSKNLKTSSDVGFNYSLGKSSGDCETVVLTSIGITNAAGGCTAIFDMDNFVCYQDVSAEDAFLNATPDELSAEYSKYISAEYIANNASLDAITSDLKLEADEELPAGVSISWESSDLSVIAEDGTVKRDALNEKTATITGTLSVDGAEDRVVTYDVTVLPLTVIGSSEIVDIDNVGATGFKTVANVVTSVVEADGNKAIGFDFAADFYTEYVSEYKFANLPSIENAKELVMSFKLRTKDHNHAGSNNVTNYGFKVNGKEIAEFTYFGKQFRPNGTYESAAATNPWHSISSSASTYDTNTDEFVDLKIVVDLTSKTAKHYINGTRIGKTDVGIGLAELEEISSMSFYVSDRHSGAVAILDDIQVRAITDEASALATLSDGEKVALIKSAIENAGVGSAAKVGDALTLNAGYASYDLETLGVDVEWTSDNTEYISNDGEAVKYASFFESVDITMTAVITAGSESDTVSFTVKASDGTKLLKTIGFEEENPTIGNAELVDDDENGKVMHILNPNAGTHKSSGTISSIGGSDWKGRYLFSADLKFVNGNKEAAGGIDVLTIAGYKGIRVFFNFGTNKISVTTTAPVYNADGINVAVEHELYNYIQMPDELIKKEGQWFNMTIDFNALSQSYVLYVDGKLITELPVLQAHMKTVTNGGGAVRGFSLECSNKGEIWADNITLRQFTDNAANEVNAALNAALIDYCSPYINPVLTNCELPAMTIGRSWHKAADAFDRDVEENGAIKVSNPSTYKYVTDGPEITWTVDGVPATEINVTEPKVVSITVTASKDGVTESKTFQKKVAPSAIRALAVNGSAAFNGIWLDANAETDKVVIAQYASDKLVDIRIVTLKDNENYNAETGVLKGVAIVPPAGNKNVDALKIFVVKAGSIKPVAFANTELHD